jgi:ElaB/YqjD/DUF883 family membrane-anchored ribosome-binding protein
MLRKIMQANADKLIRDVRILVQDAEDLIKATSGDVGERTREARAKLAGALVVAKETLTKAEETAVESVCITKGVIRSYPFQCLGIAFAVGVMVGVAAISSRRNA